MIALYRGTGPIAAAIRWQTRGSYAHASWVCADGSCIESHGKSGVVHVPSPFTQNKGLADIYVVEGLTHAQHAAVEGFLQRRVGSGYDWLGVARFLSGVNRNNMERWFCSELVAEACEMAGLPLHRTDAWRISPSTLAWSVQLRLAYAGVGPEWHAAMFGGITE